MIHTTCRVFLRAIGPLLFLVASCTGNIGDGLFSDSPPGAAPPTMGSPGGKPSADGAGPLALRRLTRREYQNTLRDLDLGIDAVDVARDIPADNISTIGFAEAALTTETEADRFLGAAELVGQTI